MLHPEGPESARTYWIRRGILLAVVLVVIVLVVVAIVNLTKSVGASSNPPDPAGGTPAPTGSPTTDSTQAATSVAATPKATDKPSAVTTIIGTLDCRPADLALALAGEKKVPAGTKNQFTVALVNNGKRPCLISITPKNFQVTVTSGKTQVWSSADCRTAMADFDKRLASGASVTWVVTWDGSRSVAGKNCQPAGNPPKPGKYEVAATLNGSQPDQLKLTLT